MPFPFPSTCRRKLDTANKTYSFDLDYQARHFITIKLVIDISSNINCRHDIQRTIHLSLGAQKKQGRAQFFFSLVAIFTDI